MSTDTFSLLIAEDHELYREGLCLMVRELANPLEILEADNFPAALSLMQARADLQLLLLDLQLPGTRGLEGLKQVRSRFPLLPLVVISALDMRANVDNVMATGASGFIAKSTPRATMVQALRAVLNGDTIILTESREAVLNFSPRHLDTLEQLALGKSNKDIAKALGIADTTVRQYLSEILCQLQVDNRVQAILEAKKRGIIID